MAFRRQRAALMPQTVKCTFERYIAPSKKDAWFLRKFVLVCEQFKLPIPVEEKTFEIVTDHPELFLKADQPFRVRGPLVDSVKDCRFRPGEYSLRYAGENDVRITMNVEEVKLSPLGRWFAALDEMQKGRYAISVVVLLGCLAWGALYPVFHYPHPLSFWAWVGHNFFDILRFSLFTFLITVGANRILRMESPFFQSLAFASTALLIVLMWSDTLLAQLVPPPPATGGRREYIDYLNSIRSTFSAGATVFVSLVPWLAIFLKWLGFDVLGDALKLSFAKGESGDD